MKKKYYWIIGVISIIIVIAIYFWFTNNNVEYKIPSCNESIRSGCKYNGTNIFTDLEFLSWVKSNLPAGSTIINWWDYGKELEYMAGMNPIIKNPSKSLEISTACYNARIVNRPVGEDCQNQQFDSEEKVKDVATFFAINNETTALCIAKKYNASYFLITGSEIGKFYWINFAAGTGTFYDTLQKGGFVELPLLSTNNTSRIYGDRIILTQENNQTMATIIGQNNGVSTLTGIKEIAYYDNGEIKNVFNNSTGLNSGLIWFSPDFRYAVYADENLTSTITTRTLLLEGVDLPHFTKIYDNTTLRIKIFKLNFNGINC